MTTEERMNVLSDIVQDMEELSLGEIIDKYLNDGTSPIASFTHNTYSISVKFKDGTKITVER